MVIVKPFFKPLRWRLGVIGGDCPVKCPVKCPYNNFCLFFPVFSRKLIIYLNLMKHGSLMVTKDHTG